MKIKLPYRRILKRIRSLDLRSDYAYYIGLLAMFVSFIVTLETLFKLLEIGTSLLWSIVISFVVFYIFTAIYSFLFLWALKYFEKNEDKL
jgi:hypothetical protein